MDTIQHDRLCWPQSFDAFTSLTNARFDVSLHSESRDCMNPAGILLLSGLKMLTEGIDNFVRFI
jgi:hypothetical protein